MSKEVLDEMDKQIVSWVEQLDTLYNERKKIALRISDIEYRLSTLKGARRALAAEWGATTEEVAIPLQYTSEGVREAIHEVMEFDKKFTVDQIVARLRARGYDFGEKNPRRVVNMALVNDPDVELDNKGRYEIIPEFSF